MAAVLCQDISCIGKFTFLPLNYIICNNIYNSYVIYIIFLLINNIEIRLENGKI